MVNISVPAFTRDETEVYSQKAYENFTNHEIKKVHNICLKLKFKYNCG